MMHYHVVRTTEWMGRLMITTHVVHPTFIQLIRLQQVTTNDSSIRLQQVTTNDSSSRHR
jgi:hypothetical protein